MKHSVNLEKLTAFIVIMVRFHDGRIRLFGSLSAIYEIYTRDDIGVNVETLYKAKIDELHEYTNKYCTVSKVPVFRCKQDKSGVG